MINALRSALHEFRRILVYSLTILTVGAVPANLLASFIVNGGTGMAEADVPGIILITLLAGAFVYMSIGEAAEQIESRRRHE